MSLKNNYSHTLRACYIAYITQSIAVNFAPLLFVTFQNIYGITLSQLSILIAATFIIQIMVDFTATKFVDKIGYRVCAVAAHIFAAVGFIMLGFLPDLFNNPFLGVMTACFFYSLGSGLLEVLVNPIVESCPTEHKASTMGLLHSFYCWGTALVIILSTVFFNIFGISNWRILSMLWAILPIVNAVFFCFVPINHEEESGGEGLRSLFGHKIFWVMIVMMIMGGAAELSMSQWASAFAESGLKVSKSVGDLAGACMFAILMGTGRLVYSRLIKKFDLIKYIAICSLLCIGAYLLASLSSNPIFALAGCALTGFCVGVFWPGTLSYASSKIPAGGTAMFGMLAFAGDIGCTIGPGLVGNVSGMFGDNLKPGLLSATIFPILLLVTVVLLGLKKEKRK